MRHTRNKSTAGGNAAIPLVLGTLLGIGVLIGGTALMVNSISSTGSYSITGIGIPAINLAAGFLGAVAAGIAGKENRFTKALIVGGGLILVLLCVGIFGFDGLGGGIWKNLIAVALGALLAGWILQKGQGRRKRRK